MRVLKFGGSSVAKPERIKNLVEILKKYYTNGEQFTVIFSAFGGVTDQLIEMGKLAEKGDNSYLPIFEEFATRHQNAIKELLEGSLQEN